jgi:ppGpp synthetase/RelA/SpoT-type nucleotidyltranferase
VALTISKINRIGEKLRNDTATEEDLQALEEFRLSFQSAYQKVFEKLTDLGLRPSGRPEKTTLSIAAKLKREQTRLSKMQNIAGCRVVVDTIAQQEKALGSVTREFSERRIDDRRQKPSHGYRAVHVVVKVDGKPVEVQLRTELQQAWAEVSEKMADVVGVDIKYGGGPASVRGVLKQLADVISSHEAKEASLPANIENGTDKAEARVVETARERLKATKRELQQICRELIMRLEDFRNKTVTD